MLECRSNNVIRLNVDLELALKSGTGVEIPDTIRKVPRAQKTHSKNDII